MSYFSKKSRTITLRISEEEYEALKSTYAAHGVRSVSELARTAIQRVIGDQHPGLESRVDALDGKVDDLKDEVARLARQLEDGMLLLDLARKVESL